MTTLYRAVRADNPFFGQYSCRLASVEHVEEFAA
jgi:hypothetical protein